MASASVILRFVLGRRNGRDRRRPSCRQAGEDAIVKHLPRVRRFRRLNMLQPGTITTATHTHTRTHSHTHTHNWVTAMLVLTLGRIGSGLLLLLAYCYFRFRCRGREYRVSTCYIDMCPLVYGLLLLATPEQPLCFYCRGGNGGAAVTRGRIYYCTNSIITKFHHYINTRDGNG